MMKYLVTVALAAACAVSARDIIEIRQYQCSSIEKAQKLNTLFDSALIPALNRAGFEKVAVFAAPPELNEGKTNWQKSVFVIASTTSFENLARRDELLATDKVFMQDAAALFTAPMKDPLFDSLESSVLQAFVSCPRVLQVNKNPERILQLRCYNSYTLERNLKKIAMFETGGELKLFHECGVEPVFFGAAVAGGKLPNLTYLVSFENPAAKEAAWNRFKSCSGWLKLVADPQYRDTANKIINIVLMPSKASQF